MAHWLSGVRPRPPVPELVAEALSRRLGRPVSVAETGLETERGSADDRQAAARWWADDPVARLVELVAVAEGNHSAAAGCVYHLESLRVPDWHQAITGRADPGPHSGRCDRIGRSEVSAAELMLPLFSDADSTFGGGCGRAALSAYLGRVVGPWLGADAAPSVRRDLLVVAARLAYLCGFMNFDDQLQGIAQRYYLASLRLAAEAGDETSYSLALRALSVQARCLGHYQQAVDLAEAAVRAGSRTASQRTCAFLFGQLAVAHAATGNRRQATANLAATERHLDRVAADPPPVGTYHDASFAHQRAAVAACLGDRAGATRALPAAVRHRPARERRSRAIMLARLAELQAADGQLELACRTWTQFLADYPHIQSARADSALINLRALVRPHQHNPAVQRLGRVIAGLAPENH
ncbi:tetratricopeptide repeat protein [Saccharopolyspora sp. 5N708]|uniref:tetratricopeptide repeat protein n=1 Tax=Saccharopolyspora sp. 5N708 TaxID=3457424 RepID=UPI003FD27345